MSVPLGRGDVDVAIVALVAAHDRISAAMYALDNHPAIAVLRTPGLTGGTQRYVADLAARVSVLWSRYAALNACLDRVRSVRDRRSRPGDVELAELTVLLREPVVPVGPDGMVLDGLVPQSTVRLPLMDLARRLEHDGADVGRRLSVLDQARSAVATRFGAPLEALTGLRADVEALGPDGVPADRLDRLDAALGEAYRAAAADPLAAPTGPGGTAGPGPGPDAVPDFGPATGPDPVAGPDFGLRELVAEINAVRREVDAVAALRDGYPARSARLRMAIDELDTARDVALQAAATAREKIAATGLPEVPAGGDALRAQLAQLDQLHRERRWSRLGRELAAAERARSAAAERTVHLRQAAEGLLERRTELRGRLDAYRAKAARLGFAEHTGLTARHRAAEDLLYRSPCDLPAATRALAAYQRYLNELSEREES